MPSYEIDGVIPVVAAGVFVHPSAVLIGDVVVETDCYIGPTASIRGDFGPIVVRAGPTSRTAVCCIRFPIENCCWRGNPTSDMVRCCMVA